ncbi:hypothetical protein AURDEDRAFT_74959, partial [Auricularia subglabra TFB-10046 SS5]
MNSSHADDASVNAILRELNHLLAASLPLRTKDENEEQFFDGVVTAQDVAEAKIHFMAHARNSAAGDDRVTAQDIEALDNQAIADLANACFRALDAPLQSKFLKFITLLVHFRIRRWIEAHNILPPSQNGFRPGFRTSNNAFILRCLVERARAEGKTVYVALVDITNAFPSTDRATLWLKLHQLGMRGRMLD